MLNPIHGHSRYFIMLLFLATGLLVAFAGGIATWSQPEVVWQQDWDDPLYFSMDDAGHLLVALIPYSGNSDTSRHIVVSEFDGNTWQTPVLIAQNGNYSDAPVQVLPQTTHPVVSGDGNTIAYVGFDGATNGLYVVNRQTGGGWGAPVELSTGLANTHYWISLSRDGNTLALADYPFLGTRHLYMMTRQNGVWGSPIRVSAENIGGGYPSLSADGRKLVYISNARVTFTEYQNGQWTSPQQLTNNQWFEYSAEYPQLSADGSAIYYWLVQLVPTQGGSIRNAQDLYLMRWDGSRWGTPQKVTVESVLPSSVTGAPAAADAQATRLIYTRPVTVTDGDQVFVSASHLDMAEWRLGSWQQARLVEQNGPGNSNRWPLLTPDGKKVIFDGGIRYIPGSAVYDALWQMTTDVAPPGMGTVYSCFLPMVAR